MLQPEGVPGRRFSTLGSVEDAAEQAARTNPATAADTARAARADCVMGTGLGGSSGRDRPYANLHTLNGSACRASPGCHATFDAAALSSISSIKVGCDPAESAAGTS